MATHSEVAAFVRDLFFGLLASSRCDFVAHCCVGPATNDDSSFKERTIPCGPDANFDDPRWSAGFLPSWRPFDGTLDTVAVDQVLQTLVLSDVSEPLS